MSYPPAPRTAAAPAPAAELAQLDKLCTSIRGKLQFMDYLVRAAVADIERYEGEADAGTRIFLRQLIDMHAQTLGAELETMRSVGELCRALERVTSLETMRLVKEDAA